MYKLSPSSLNLMVDCKRCFWLQYVKGIKRPEFSFPSLPSAMDRIIKEHFDRFIDKGVLPPEIRDNELCKDCNLFSNLEKLKVWRNAWKGITYEEDGFMLFGAIDNVLEKDGKLIVLDYKTKGSAPEKEVNKYNKLQLSIYNFLLRKNGYETEDYGYLLYYFPKSINSNCEFKFEVELKKIYTDVDLAERTFRESISIINNKDHIPKANENCSFCNWAYKSFRITNLI